MTGGARAELATLFEAALDAVRPERALAPHVVRRGGTLAVAGRPLAPGARVHALAAGKAAPAMARAFARLAGDDLARGLLVARAGEAPAAPGFACLVAGHPLPDARSEAAGERALAFAASVPEGDVLVALLSGGASALLAAPLAGLSLADLRTTNDLLLRSGADIAELNTVRKHLVRTSGGRLAGASRAERVEVLAICDVAGDDAAVFASGPFAADPTRYADAEQVLRRRGVWDAAPAAVREHLAAGAAGARPESRKPGDPALARVHHTWVANLAFALAAAEEAARARGLEVERDPEPLAGEAREAGLRLARAARARPPGRPRLLLAGGETTVQVRGPGQGGRCQELALAAALALDGVAGVTLLAAGTDGSDGPTDAAGAFADGGTVARGARAGRDARLDLARNDSYAFFSAEGGLFRTGPTGTNVADLVLVRVEAGP